MWPRGLSLPPTVSESEDARVRVARLKGVGTGAVGLARAAAAARRAMEPPRDEPQQQQQRWPLNPLYQGHGGMGAAPQQPPGAPVTPGMYDAATLAQLNAQTARHIQQRRAAMAHRLAQQQRQRAQMEVERERNHGWTGISPLARVADVGRLRHLRQRALYSIMFHGTQQELLDRMSPNIVPAQMYLSGASEVLPPFPAVTG